MLELSTRAKAIALWLNQLVPSHADVETATERMARMETYGAAYDISINKLTCEGPYKATEKKPCKPKWRGDWSVLVVTLGTQMWFETKLDRELHAGNCKKYECDPSWARDPKNPKRYLIKDGKKVRTFKARTSFQLHRTTEEAKKYWDIMVGTGFVPTANATYVAGSLFARNQCGGDRVKMFASMDGRGCRVNDRGKRRAAWFHTEHAKFNNIYWKLKNEEEKVAKADEEKDDSMKESESSQKKPTM